MANVKNVRRLGLAREAFSRNAARGVLCGFDADGEPLVDFPENETGRPVPAVSTVPLGANDCGREIVLLFEGGDATRAIVVGLRISPNNRDQKAKRDLVIEVDGERITLSAEKEISLKCGKASIQLLSDGSVRIRGANVLSRASATNRIRGGNVQIN